MTNISGTSTTGQAYLQQQSSADKGGDGIQIRNCSLNILIKDISQLADYHTGRIFSAWQETIKHEYTGDFNPLSALMLAALETSFDALKRRGLPVQSLDQLPDNVHLLVREAVTAVKDSLARAKIMPSQSKAAEFINKIETADIDFKLEEIRQIQQAHARSKTPFSKLAQHQMWRMCIDPIRLAFINRYLNSANANPLLPFLFDTDPSYLHNVLNGWMVSMQHLDHPLNVEFLTMLHDACEPASLRNEDGFCEGRAGFLLRKGKNMTEDGKAEFLAFAERVRKTYPGYGLMDMSVDTDVVAGMLEEEEDQAEAIWQQLIPGDFCKMQRFPVPGHVIKALVNEFLGDFEQRMRDDPDNKLAHIVQLCQELERLHPFKDGNCRSFCLLLLNNLLARYDLPLSMPEDPNMLDGCSLKECVEKVIEGQARVRKWENPRPEASRRTSIDLFRNS